MSMIEVSDNLRAAVAYFGATGKRWLDELPDVVASIEADWGITRKRTLAGGNFAYVAEAVLANGEPAVLKVALPRNDDSFTQELRALRAAGGDPYARLIRFDEERRGLLLERLGRQLAELGWSVDRQLAAITATVARGWRPVDGEGLESGAMKAEWLAEFIPSTWRTLGRPCLERSVERAVDYAMERARALHGQRSVLVHGDAHPWNVLEARYDALATDEEPSFRLIDPEGLASEPAHDLGVVLRGWNEELLETTEAADVTFRRCEWVGRSTGVDPESIWRWSYIERVSSGLFIQEIGHRDQAKAYLEVADRLADAIPPWG